MEVAEEIPKLIAHMLGTVVPEYVIVIKIYLVPGAKLTKDVGLKEKEEEQLCVNTSVNYFEFST